MLAAAARPAVTRVCVHIQASAETRAVGGRCVTFHTGVAAPACEGVQHTLDERCAARRGEDTRQVCSAHLQRRQGEMSISCIAPEAAAEQKQ
jgi:hypothetical protein